MEAFLERRGIPTVDGFGAPNTAGFRYFSPRLYNDPGQRVRLFKLHGSVGWIVPHKTEDWWERRIAISTDPEGADRAHGAGEFDFLELVEPTVGTYNKVSEYTLVHHLSEIWHCFHSSLDAANLAVVSGYGFRDHGVNAQIIRWVLGNRDRRVVVIDPRLGDCRVQFSLFWDRWKDAGVLFSLEGGIGDYSWQNVIETVRSN